MKVRNITQEPQVLYTIGFAPSEQALILLAVQYALHTGYEPDTYDVDVTTEALDSLPNDALDYVLARFGGAAPEHLWLQLADHIGQTDNSEAEMVLTEAQLTDLQELLDGYADAPHQDHTHSLLRKTAWGLMEDLELTSDVVAAIGR